MIRNYIKNEILASYYYRDADGRKNESTTMSFLFSYEIDYIKNVLGFKVVPICVGYNLVYFNNKNDK
jgi:hypothetical protein